MMLVTAGEAVEVPSESADWFLTGGSTKCYALWKYLKPGERGDDLSLEVKMSCGYVSIMFFLAKLDPKKPCRTISKTVLGNGGLLHWIEARRMSVGELKRMSSFSDAFRFPSNYEDAVSLIGNSVPPLFLAAVAGTVKRTLGKAGRRG